MTMTLDSLRELHPQHWRRAAALRILAADAVQAARSGHPGMPLGMADVMTVLVRNHLKFHANDADWPDRDRLVLSAGHGSMLLYGMLYLTGHSTFDIEQIKQFRQLGSHTAGHPEYEPGSGVETTTGPLGQGLANAVGFAIAEESLRARFGEAVIDHRTYAIVGDGCLMEGISHEAIGLAGHLGLSRLIVLWDDNGITIDGAVELADSCSQEDRFRASGWMVQRCDGHDPEAIDHAISRAHRSDRPTLIACQTRIGFGAPSKEGSAAAHGAPLGEDEIAGLRKALGWEHPPFHIPDTIVADWRAIGERGAPAAQAWRDRLAALPDDRRREFDRRLARAIPPELTPALIDFKREMVRTCPQVATRKASEMVLERVNGIIHEHVGGSADLTGSNNTRTRDLGIFDRACRSGRYIHYGIREHAMAGAMNGMALHGGIRPYGGTFLCFADYCKPAIRLSALMKLPVTYVMTHDSIGLGEDGPTHQPIEHLAMLRAMPNVKLLRPCDAIETAEAWSIAVESRESPTVLALTRQSVPTLRTGDPSPNQSERGAYVMAEATAGDAQAILIASGSEVALAMTAREHLETMGIGTRVVSMPCWELFTDTDVAYRREVLPAGPVRVGIEAGCSLGWERWLGDETRSAFIGLDSFGASAPAEQLFVHFGVTVQAIVRAVEDLL